MCYRVGLKAMRATTTTALVDTECLKTQPNPDEMVAVPELAGMVERKMACAGEKSSGLGDIGRKGWLAFVLLVGAMGAQAHAQSVDGRVERGTRTYYCDVWNSASIRAHVLFVEYFYQQGGQWYNVSRRCDPGSANVNCEIDPGSSRGFDSRIPLGQYPVSACRAHFGPGRW